MHSSGHAGVSSLLYAPILFVLLFVDLTLAITGLFLIAVLSTTPDLDVIFHFETSRFHKMAIIGKRIPSIKHRGITHSVWFMIGIGVLLSVISFVGYPVFEDLTTIGRIPFSVAVFVLGFLGIFGHDLGDWITPTGINVWYPYGDDPKAVTFHSENPYFVKLRTYSNQKQTGIRDTGILTVAGSDKANYLANIIGLTSLGVAGGAYILGVSEGLLVGIGIFCVGYLILVSFPIIIAQRKEIIKYLT